MALRDAAKSTGQHARVVRAWDWDPTACNVYLANHNISEAQIIQRQDISKLTSKQIIAENANLWLLSPSCQPYTVLNPNRNAGGLDPRAVSFLHLITNIVPELAAIEGALPTYLLLENVAGFETSSTRAQLVSILQSTGYALTEFLLTPTQFGIPNSRLRYYLLAKHVPTPTPTITTGQEILRSIPGVQNTATITPIRAYLDPPSQSLDVGKIPDKILERWGKVFDIVLPSSERTCCFTRGYTHLVQGAGSILQMNETLDTTLIFEEYETNHDISVLHDLHLRYFTPSELLRLLHFTTASNETFHWLDSLTDKAKYRLIGNSVNVAVVSLLLQYLMCDA